MKCKAGSKDCNVKKKTKETLANLHSVLLEHHYFSLRKMIMGKRETAAKISTGIPIKCSFVDASCDEYFCIARGLEDFTLSLFTTLVEIQHLYEEFVLIT